MTIYEKQGGTYRKVGEIIACQISNSTQSKTPK